MPITKHIPLIFFCLLVNTIAGISQSDSGKIRESQHFAFYSDYWINLHHFLFQLAKGDQQKHLQDDGNALVDIGDDRKIHLLSNDDTYVLLNAVKYYRDNLITKSLLFHLDDMRLWLQQQVADQPITDTAYSVAFTQILNDFAPVYSRHFWENHDAHNQKILNEYFETILDLEAPLTARLGKLAGMEWPDTIFRVDLTAYANWAGAYTQEYPTINVFISTLDPLSDEPAFVETVFHEGSHIIFSRKSAFRSRIYHMSKEMEIDFPKHLWHASQFYLCGTLVQDGLEEKGEPYVLIMDRKQVFTELNSPAFRELLDAYIQGNVDMEKTIHALLLNLE